MHILKQLREKQVETGVTILRCCDKFIREDPLVDEFWLEAWRTFGVPDGADEDILREIAEDSEELAYIEALYDKIRKTAHEAEGE